MDRSLLYRTVAVTHTILKSYTAAV